LFVYKIQVNALYAAAVNETPSQFRSRQDAPSVGIDTATPHVSPAKRFQAMAQLLAERLSPAELAALVKQVPVPHLIVGRVPLCLFPAWLLHHPIPGTTEFGAGHVG
jgi:hypothetical protein